MKARWSRLDLLLAMVEQLRFSSEQQGECGMTSEAAFLTENGVTLTVNSRLGLTAEFVSMPTVGDLSDRRDSFDGTV